MRNRIAGACLATVAALSVAAILASTASAGSMTVSVTNDEDLNVAGNLTNGNCTLREAIREANSNLDATSPDCDFSPDASGADSITLTANTYTVSGAPAANGLTGDIDVTETLNLGKASGLAMLNRGSGLDRVLTHLGGTLSLDHVGVSSGFASTSGGGIRNTSGDLSISNSRFANNQATGASGTLGGGAIYMAAGVLVVESTTFDANSVVAGVGATAARGGAVQFESGSGGFVFESEFTGNSATTTDTTNGVATGGAIASTATANANTLEIVNSSFINNAASQVLSAGNASVGGAIYWSDGNNSTSAELRLDNSTFSGNHADSSGTNLGGAIFLENGTGKIAQVTFGGNTTTAAAGEGDAIFYLGNPGSGSFQVKGSVFDDSGTDECVHPSNAFSSSGFNVDQGTTCGLAVAGQDQQNQDAATLAPAQNGGPTRTRALPLGANPAVDANGGCSSTGGGFVSNDQRFAPRGLAGPEDGTACDSGAYERITCKGLAVTVTGTDGNDSSITGTTSPDVISGFGGDDTIFGGGNNDKICGGAGNDEIRGQDGADEIDGEGGTNTLSYADAPSAVQVDLAAGTASGGAGADFGITNISHVNGSALNDTIAGNAAANTLNGADGNDTLEGRVGTDTLNGGTGGDPDDRIVYDEAPGGVTVNLGTGFTTGGDGTDTLSFIENATGSSIADTFFGNSAVNELNGLGGNDLIDYGALGGDTSVNLATGVSSGAGGANDQLFAIENATTGVGNDTLTGDGGANILNGGENSDSITGGGGTDTLNGANGTDSLFARDTVLDQVNCGAQADSAEVDVTGTDTVNADCETVSFATAPQTPITPNTPTTPVTPVTPGTTPATCPKGKKRKVVKGKVKCVKKKRRK